MHNVFGSFVFFFFNDTATTEIYTLSLHDALPIYIHFYFLDHLCILLTCYFNCRSEEHTSELQSLRHLVCRLLLEKKKPINAQSHSSLSYIACGLSDALPSNSCHRHFVPRRRAEAV